MKEVEIYSAQLCASYNFTIDEHTPLGLIAEEVVSVIVQKEQSDINGNISDALFYDKRKKIIFDMTKTPAELGIKSGDRLCLV